MRNYLPTKSVLGSRGLSLMELAVALAVIAVIAIFTANAFQTNAPLRKLQMSTKRIYYDLLLAKFNAMEGQTYISVCFDKTFSVGEDETVKFDHIVVRSPDCNATHFKEIIKTARFEQDTLPLTKTMASDTITFTPTGFVDGINNMTIILSVQKGDTQIDQNVTINRFGRITIGKTHEHEE